MFHRIAHRLYKNESFFLASLVAALSRWCTGIEIHPGAQLGQNIVIDHGMGVVIGETAIVGDECILYHGVTLGGTSLAKAKRHPTLGRGVVVGSGAKILGNIQIGDYCKVGSNAVVIQNAPANSTIVGIPGRIISQSNSPPSDNERMAHGNLPDPVLDTLQELEARIRAIETTRRSN